jgi:hypothetical protein
LPWLRESEFWRAEAAYRSNGKEGRDPTPYVSWRDEARPGNVALLDFYGRYLVGQFAGMGSALSLDAVRAALDICQVEREAWPDVTARLLYLHGMVVEATKKD